MSQRLSNGLPALLPLKETFQPLEKLPLPVICQQHVNIKNPLNLLMFEMWGITECYLLDEEHLSRAPCLHGAFLEKAETSLLQKKRGEMLT